MMIRVSTILVLIAALLPATTALGAKKRAEVHVDPAKAGPDYAIQGEYVGKVDTDEGTDTWGVQLVARGAGKFILVGYAGGLPGDGWQRGDRRVSAEGKTTGDATIFEGDQFTAEVKDGKLNVHGPGGELVGTLKKIVRKSPTFGAKPPTGAIVLFDGSSADSFDNGKIVMGKLLSANCSSKQKFGDHTLHLEFRTPFVPAARGQERGNSGVYVQSRYEVQILDSFGLEGENNECGGIYKVAVPRVNMCFPPLTWQTYDIDFTAARYDGSGRKIKNARATIKHNGIVIHDDLELPRDTPGRMKEGSGPAPLYLQGHGNPVVYQNIWVVETR